MRLLSSISVPEKLANVLAGNLEKFIFMSPKNQHFPTNIPRTISIVIIVGIKAIHYSERLY